MERYADALASELKIQNKKLKVKEFGFSVPSPLFSGRRKFFWRLGVYPFLAQCAQGDINHIIDHSYARAIKYLDPKKTVITCHDLIPLSFEKDSQAMAIFKETISYLPRAQKIIAVSEATKKDLVEKLGVDPRKVVVVYEGVEKKFKVSAKKAGRLHSRSKEKQNAKFQIPKEKKVILHVGNSLEYKNIEGLLEAFAKVREQEKDVILVKVGRFTESQLDLIAKLKLRSEVEIFTRPCLSEEDLVAMYNLATVTCIPSHQEGFGFPVLESLACGTPVVCSNTSSLSEVGGKAAIYCDPKDPADIALKILTVLHSNYSNSGSVIREGIMQAKKFTWKKCAEETLGVYKQVASVV
ncbi:MAG: glycosyltransferase family 1 protein [bacterium]